MMDAFDLASRLFGNSRAESRGDVSNSLDILTATGAGDSSDGAATVYLDADVTPADDYDGDDYAIGIPTSPNVIEGDGVLVGLTGSGPLKTPVVISNPGSGDRMQVQISNAETLAEQAEAVANATGQHFWYDEGGDGAHVTQVTREEWEGGTQTGPNSLWNSQGMLFRDGSNDLLALLPAQRHTETFEGDGTTTTFTLSRTPTSITSVTIPGVAYAEGTDYTISGSTITFATAPESGITITVRYSVDATETFTGDGTTTDFTLSETPGAVESVTVDDVAVSEASAISVPFSHDFADSSYWSYIEREYLTALGGGWAHFECGEPPSGYEETGASIVPLIYGLSLTGGESYPIVVEVANCSAASEVKFVIESYSSAAFSNTFRIDSSAFSNGTYNGLLTAKADQSGVTRLFYAYVYAYTASSFDMRITLYDSSNSAIWLLLGDAVRVTPAPASGSTVAVSYGYDVTDSLAGDGTTTAFALTTVPTEVGFVGIPDESITDYTIDGTALTLPSAPYDGAELVVDYKTNQSSVTIFDGDGNGEDNITSVFSEDYVRIGGKVPVETDIGGSGASIEFFDQTDTHTSRMDAFTSIVEDEDFYDMRNETSIATSLDDNGRVVDTDSKGEAALSLEQELSYGLIDSNEQFTEVHAALVADATYDKDALYPTTSHARVSATATTDADGGLSYAELIGDAIGLGESEGNITYVRTPQVVVGVSQPEATYTGTDTTATASASGWTISYMNNVQGGSNVAGYFTFSNGVITALRDELLEISGVAYWNSGAVGQYGFGIFIGSSTVGSGTEKSVFDYKASASGQFSVAMPPRCVPVSAGTKIAVGRYSVSGSVYRNGLNMSFVTIRVVEDRSS